MLSQVLPLVLLQLSGILGVGIFALPYLFYHSNLYFAFIGLIIASLITYKVNTSYIKVITTLKTKNQLSGYAQILLGPRSKNLVGLNMLLLGLGALLAFVQMSGKFIGLIFNIHFGSYFFVAILLLFFLSKQNLLKQISKYLPIFFIFIPIILFLFSLSSAQITPINQTPNLDFLGWTMFAISGFTVLPELWIRASSSPSPIKLFKLSSALGLVLAILIYSTFIIATINLSGTNISPDVVSSLALNHPSLAVLVAIFGLLSVTKASLNFLEVIFDVVHYDFQLNQTISKIIACFVPLFGLLILNFNYDKPIKLLATISVFSSIAIIFALRLRLGHTPNYKKFIMATCLALFFLATASELR